MKAKLAALIRRIHLLKEAGRLDDRLLDHSEFKEVERLIAKK